MYWKVSFKSFPSIKYSHYFVKNNYFAKYHSTNNTIEIAYIVNGTLHAKKNGREIFTAAPGSIMIFSSNEMLTLESDKDVIHVHHTIQLEGFHDAQLCAGDYVGESSPDNAMILPVCMKCGEDFSGILQKILNLTKKCSSPGGMNSYTNVIEVLGLFNEISDKYLKDNHGEAKEPFPSSISSKIKKIISEKINTSLTINDIAKMLQRSPNYINKVFRQTENITIRQYINKERTVQIIHYMNNNHLPFKSACEKVGVFDISYGYRMFRKITGTTPKTYMKMLFNEPVI